MKRPIILLLSLLFLATSWAQTIHLEFQDVSLSYVLTHIDESFADANIHFVVDEVKGYRVNAKIDESTAFGAVKKVLVGLPFAAVSEAKNIFISYQKKDENWRKEAMSSNAISSYRLREVLVIDHMPQTTITEDGLVIDIKGSDLQYRGSALDVLAYLPGVNIVDGEISVYDSSNPVIYIDDIRVNTISELSSLRSEEIARISLDETANSMYQTQNGTVVRIFTIAPKLGCNAMANALVSQGRRTTHREEAKGEWNSENLRLSGGFAYQKKNEYQKHRSMYSVAVMTPSVPSVNPYFNMSFRWNKYHTVVAKYDVLNITKDVPYWSGIVHLNGMNYINSINQDVTGPTYEREWLMNYSPRHNAQIVYTGRISRAKTRLELEYYKDKLSITQRDHSYDTTSPIKGGEKNNGIGNNLWVESLNIDIPFQSFSISFGNEFTTTKRLDSFRNTALNNTTINTLRRETQVAIYAIAEWRLGDKKLHLGVRDEYLTANIKKPTSQNTFDKNYLLPHADIFWSTEKGEWSVAYSAHSQRPTYNQLNGYSRFNQYMLFMSGNPDLKPATRHSFNVQYKNRIWYANLKYQHINNYIASSVEYKYDAYKMNYDNIPSADELLVNTMYSPKLKWWNPVVSASLLAQNISMSFYDKLQRSFNRPVLFIDLHSPFVLCNNSQVWIDGHFHSTGHIGTALQKHTGTINIGYARQFGHLNLSLHSEDILRTGDVKFECYGIGTVYNHWTNNDTRRVVFTVNYTF